jgi:hypothetical protein
MVEEEVVIADLLVPITMDHLADQAVDPLVLLETDLLDLQDLVPLDEDVLVAEAVAFTVLVPAALNDLLDTIVLRLGSIRRVGPDQLYRAKTGLR